ncbi:MAG: hypothetical protein WCA46_24845 [Actinocatenispora sp.]
MPYPAPPRPRRTGLVIGIIVAIVLALVAATGVAYLFRGGDEFGVGTCVTRHGDRAEPASCDAPGSYRVTRQVADRTDCPNPAGPVLDLQGADGNPIRCLTRVPH